MVKSSIHQKRFYREISPRDGLVHFTMTFKETDLFIAAVRSLEREATDSILKYRAQIEDYIERVPGFKESLIPLPSDSFAPKIVREMLTAAERSGVGPMAAVAGAMAECVGRDLLAYSPEVLVENGGDLFVSVDRDIVVGVLAGESPLSGRLALKIHAKETPIGICTSSGTVGHSLSFGTSDAVTILAKSAALADAAATSVGNLISGKEAIGKGLQRAREIDGVLGALIIKDDKLGAWGNVELVESQGLAR